MVLSPANVRQVRQISPFRYPGGKTWLVPAMARLIQGLPQRPALLLEAFAGGASIGLAAADQGLAGRVLLVERDPDVAAVWHVAAAGPEADLRRLQDRITSFVLDLPAVQDAIAAEPADPVGRAFRTILRNRVQRGGILAKNAGLLKAGEKGRGLGSRWYPETLARRLDHVRALADAGRLRVAEGCGLDAIAAHARPDVLVFADPPYTAGGKAAGRRLYRLPALDHGRLLDLLAAHPGPAVATYDDNPEIRRMAEDRGLGIHAARMRSTHHAEMTELLLTRHLSP